MLIVPIGHNQGFYRQPWLTYGLMGACLLVHLASYRLNPPAEQRAALQLARDQLTRSLWREHGAAWVAARRPDLRTWPAAKLDRVPDDYRAVRQAFLTDMTAGRVVPRSDSSYAKWQAYLVAERDALGTLGLAHSSDAASWTLITYAFVHGDWLHLIGNMLFLWICGCNLEDRWGRGLWAALYFGGAVVSALAYGYWHDWNPDHRLIGASGAVAAAMGAFIIVAYAARVRLFYLTWFGHLFVGTFEVPAYVAMSLWMIDQLIGVSAEGARGRVGYSAHLGGVAFGAAFAIALRLSGVDRRLRGRSKEEATTRPASPHYLEAMAARDRGDDVTARARFEQLLAQDPDSPEAAFELLQITLRTGDREAAAKAAERALRNLARDDDRATIARVWQDLCRVDPHPRLNEHAWLVLARSLADHDRATALACYLAAAEQHPDSPLRPKALLEAARLHLELNNARDATALLRELGQLYAGTPYADQAHALCETHGLHA